ncbi:MAG: BPSS1780 family membrane protein [Thiobacillaceae bacterium]|nr:BPSS1780 family membrane protein [Thiobacillaceae bacterium]MCX7674163.1 BPSS1780 family membrane protein [Thiobacillaceae bacterium]MDW8323594.1 BPSS1780 family membrane protein [Burkholderiales bacterium]
MQRLTVTRVPAGAALAWIATGWRLFTPAVIAWMGMSAAFYLAAYALTLVPYAGPMLLNLATPFVAAAYMAAAQAAERGEPTGLVHVGAGWYRGRQALLVIGAVYVLSHLLIGQIMTAMSGGAIERLVELTLQAQQGGGGDAAKMPDPQSMQALLDAALPAALIGSLLFAPVFMATWFAPALALFEDFPAARALYWSLWACLVNWRPMLLFALLLFLMLTVAIIIPLGLGLLVFMPLAMTATYAAYRAQFVRRDSLAWEAT